ncbi:MAG: hypothetical protein ACOX9R_13330 [Armatimonadota bacterium]|jgi:hypothetical protein
MRSLITIILACMTVCGASAQGGALLHSCESLDGVSLGMGRQLDESKLFVSHAAEHVTEGAGAVGAVSFSPEDATGNTYISLHLPIEPTDFTERALLFDATSSTPERSRALYVRGYDSRGSMVLSWMTWAGALDAEARSFRLTPGDDADGLSWEPGRIEAEDRSEVIRLEFITGTGERGVHFNLVVDNVRAVTAQ